jgi:hypothetical protein
MGLHQLLVSAVTINVFILLNICIRLNYNDIPQGKIRTTNTYK